MMDDLENAASPEAGAEVVSPTPEISNAPALDNDESLEALYDKIAAGAEKPVEAAPQEAAAEPVSDQPQKTDIAPAADPASEAPHSWSADKKALWANIPPEVRPYIAQREMEAHQQISRLGQEIASVKPLRDLVTSRQDMFDRNGFAPIDGIQRLFEAQDVLERDPVQGLVQIANAFGVDLAATFGGQPGADGQGANPEVMQLNQKVRQLEQRLAQADNTSKARELREADVRRTEAKSIVDKWGEGKEHFARDDVRKLMGTLMGNGQANDLDDAYDKAINAIPEVRTLIADAAKKAADTKALQEATKAAAEAKKHRGMNGGTRTGQPAKGTRWDDDSYLEATFDRVSAG